MLDQLIAPSSVPSLWWLIFGLCLVVMVTGVVFGLWLKDYTPKLKVSPVKVTDQERWVARIDDIVARHVAAGVGPGDQARALHLELATELRAILGERSQTDVSSWQVGRLAQVEEFREVAELIASWEVPSFAPQARADILAARERAVKVVLAW
ncbi:hypothetical protein [Trueperella pecoris]|uniref:Uncharacterized protein n=1 Tax=Trueperella pecoris TaxID=2733571 RepID=A0A7M1QUI0_9ACTO|nr:hypothetical protein [Trueperella pecoris]QOQ39572.1 hypothetical protein HLG82_09075 [Trueperella pecoris]QOR45802.1 hypothetical protein INS88_00755 [Trueperella pecoris]QTG75631.1 hypothetical protein J4179_00690 [Trueperella pecoris]